MRHEQVQKVPGNQLTYLIGHVFGAPSHLLGRGLPDRSRPVGFLSLDVYRVSQSETDRGSEEARTSMASAVKRPASAIACADDAAQHHARGTFSRTYLKSPSTDGSEAFRPLDRGCNGGCTTPRWLGRDYPSGRTLRGPAVSALGNGDRDRQAGDLPPDSRTNRGPSCSKPDALRFRLPQTGLSGSPQFSAPASLALQLPVVHRARPAVGVGDVDPRDH